MIGIQLSRLVICGKSTGFAYIGLKLSEIGTDDDQWRGVVTNGSGIVGRLVHRALREAPTVGRRMKRDTSRLEVSVDGAAGCIDGKMKGSTAASLERRIVVWGEPVLMLRIVQVDAVMMRPYLGGLQLMRRLAA